MGHRARRGHHNVPPRRPAEAVPTTQLQQRYNRADQSDCEPKKGKKRKRRTDTCRTYFHFREDLLLVVLEPADVKGVSEAALVKLKRTMRTGSCDGPRLRHNAGKTGPRFPGRREPQTKSHRHVAAPNRHGQFLKVTSSQKKRTHRYLHQKVFPPPLVHQDSLEIEFAR